MCRLTVILLLINAAVVSGSCGDASYCEDVDVINTTHVTCTTPWVGRATSGTSYVVVGDTVYVAGAGVALPS